MKFKLIFSILGLLMALNGFFMLLGIPFAIYYHEAVFPLFISGGSVIAIGLLVWLLFKRQTDVEELTHREGYLIVAFGWLSMAIVGTVPYLVSGAIGNVTDAFFETMSGLTTTGASILNDIEAVPKSILFWRSLTQWIGGMGIIVLTVALLPLIGVGGMQMFVAEAPGISPDKIKPRIRQTAVRLWLIYVSFTVTETVLLMAGGMTFFDALNHGLTTMATGGFSTKNASIIEQSAYIQYVIMFFMFMAGVNFSLTYFALKFKFKKVWENEEFKAYLTTIIMFIAITTAGIYVFTHTGFEKSFRDAAFQVISIITTTGYVSADYTGWAPLLTVLFFFFMFLGGSAGSTAGGVKIVRHVVLMKNSFLEFKRLLHPSAIIPVRLNGKAVSPNITYHVLAFIMIYITVFVIGAILVGFTGLDLMTTISAVATSLGNIGPGFAGVGPLNNFAAIPQVTKWILSFLMLVGRLELFTILILLTPYFWKRF
jgi:trk system potassium uptake protein TrkH